MPTPGAAIPIGFTNQKVSGHAGLVPFCGFLHWQRFHALLAGVRPHVRTSPKAIPPADLALGFIVIPPPRAAIARSGHCNQRPTPSDRSHRIDPIGSAPHISNAVGVVAISLKLSDSPKAHPPARGARPSRWCSRLPGKAERGSFGRKGSKDCGAAAPNQGGSRRAGADSSSPKNQPSKHSLGQCNSLDDSYQFGPLTMPPWLQL